jgi:hypothetical protein
MLEATPAPPRLGAATRWLLVGLLIILLLALGGFNKAIMNSMGQGWDRLLSSLHLQRLLSSVQQGVHENMTRRSLPAAFTYALIYVGACLLLLRLLLFHPAQWRLTLRLYGLVVLAIATCVLVGKVGHAPWAFHLSRRLTDFLISPIPVAGLLVLFRSGLGPNAAQ